MINHLINGRSMWEVNQLGSIRWYHLIVVGSNDMKPIKIQSGNFYHEFNSFYFFYFYFNQRTFQFFILVFLEKISI